MNFDVWLDTLVEEKGLDTEHLFTAEGPEWGANWIPLGCVLEAIKAAPEHEQEAIKRQLVQLDFCNRNILPYFEHLAQAMAL